MDTILRRQFLSGIISESTYRELTEAQPVAAAPAAVASPTTPAAPVAPTSQQDAAAESTIETALAKIVANLEPQLTAFAQTQGNRDGKLDLIPEGEGLFNEAKLDEGLALLGGLALSAPAILKGGAWIAGKLGKKVDSQALQNVSTLLASKADKLHHLYQGSIEKIIKKIYPTINPETNHKVSGIILTALIAALAVDATSTASHAFKAGEMAHAGAEGILASIKGSEVGAFVAKEIPSILRAIGLFS